MTTTRRPLILIVEDEPALLNAMSHHLADEGFAVAQAGTAALAREVLWTRQPDLILLDVLLPDGSGFDLCAEIRPATSAPIVYVTALGKDREVVRGFEAGGDDYICKPFSLDVLTARVNAHLRRHSSPASTRLDLPPLHLDFLTGRVSLNDVEADLTKREIQLLAYFATRVGRGSTQEEILATVWGDRSGLPTNTVRQHISTLRRKLGLGPGSAFELVCMPDGRYVFQQLRFGGPAESPNGAAHRSHRGHSPRSHPGASSPPDTRRLTQGKGERDRGAPAGHRVDR
jgi:DNA-binding response OmpR family regulator